MPFELFKDRNRLATFVAIFLAGGVLFTLTVTIGLYVQDILGYSALRAGIGFIPFVLAMGVGLAVSSQLVSMFSPRVLTIAGGVLVLGAMLYGSTLQRGIPYFPEPRRADHDRRLRHRHDRRPADPLGDRGVGFDQIGPVSAIALMLQNLGGPLVLAIIQAVITSRTLYLGGTTGPVKNMDSVQMHALDQGYAYGLLWVAAVAVIVGAVALFIGYTAEQVGACAGSQGRDRPGRPLDLQ